MDVVASAVMWAVAVVTHVPDPETLRATGELKVSRRTSLEMPASLRAFSLVIALRVQ
jgi:hypothetical protein